ncbi:uncharacterized protein BP01DRAFT_91248 [Aspergillus saccharolyticus JOP 1030-1]|uniref:Secreted protein n=1 Tax=Aspergillus saccharolyticus JOP 1030-1 TaxID=1450539 RepID=A0A318ZCD0_9EURO|nr:hypothetical protein BP01DRAFT_91248 [Aspergillus saccharolyticus JOP 1030-1]PYH43964.1 hypothetical protein BP01DRAFT_91248 [Aspergillus saccharolyticus JOP 1030-1]
MLQNGQAICLLYCCCRALTVRTVPALVQVSADILWMITHSVRSEMEQELFARVIYTSIYVLRTVSMICRSLPAEVHVLQMSTATINQSEGRAGKDQGPDIPGDNRNRKRHWALPERTPFSRR